MVELKHELQSVIVELQLEQAYFEALAVVFP